MKLIAFCPADDNNLPNFQKLENSLRKFHTKEEIPLIRVIKPTTEDINFWYRAKPIIAKELMEKGYDTVIGIDADQIITGSLEGIWEGDFDVATVLNDPTYQIRTWDIAPYFNNGLVIMKSKAFVDHWYRLCMSQHFFNYQFREQDILNILCSDYSNYKVKVLDKKKVYGEWAKSLWKDAFIKDDKLLIPYNGGEIQICVIHFGGGDTPDKGNYRIRFQDPVIDYIDKLIK